MSKNKFSYPISAELQRVLDNFFTRYNSYLSQMFTVQKVLKDDLLLYSFGLGKLVDLQEIVNRGLEPLRQSISQSTDLSTINQVLSSVTDLIPDVSIDGFNEFVQTFESYPIEEMSPSNDDEVVEVQSDTSLSSKLIKHPVLIFLLTYLAEKILDAGLSQIDFDRIFLELLKLVDSLFQ